MQNTKQPEAIPTNPVIWLAIYNAASTSTTMRGHTPYTNRNPQSHFGIHFFKKIEKQKSRNRMNYLQAHYCATLAHSVPAYTRHAVSLLSNSFILL